MYETMKQAGKSAVALVAALVLAGCGSLSKVDDKGNTQEPVWPDTKDITFKNGSYPNLDDLRLVGPGMSKDQLYNLLGRPHFGEGLVGVREWDYWFHFRTPQGDLSCQYKVLFDSDKRAQNFLWKDPACADLLAGAPVKTAEPAQRDFSLGADVLFGFDSATLSHAGRQAVEKVAGQLREHAYKEVHVVGHTDRLGGERYNKHLSERRAQAVAHELRTHGVDAARITVVGAGASQPLVNCGPQQRSELLACLKPNRRVDISVRG